MGNPWSIIMAMQIVMDHNGDTRHHFDPNDADALAASGEVAKISSFNPTAEETLFFPRLIGG